MNSRVPDSHTNADQIRAYAQELDGYSVATIDELSVHHAVTLAALNSGSGIPRQVFVLRCALFYEYRRAHMTSTDPDTKLVNAILTELRASEQKLPTGAARALVTEIANCPIVELCLNGGAVGHPCQRVVSSQTESGLMSRQVPEPWNGNIETAPILYVSSNPSISEDEVYPTGHWDDISMAEYFSKRFNTRWVIDGSRSLEKDGTYSKPVKFWSTVRNGTTEFIERPAVPGEDYALTEVVHCKSKTDDVAASAVDHCANRYLDRVLGISPARIIGVMGAKAGSVFADLLEVERRVGGIHTASLGNTTRSIVFLGGPGADPHPKKILTACAPQDVETVRRYFRGDGDVA